MSPTLKKCLTTIIAVGLSFVAANSSHAVIIMTITDDGTDLTMTATGTYDISALATSFGNPLGANAAVAPAINGGVYGWESYPNIRYDGVSYSGNLTGTTNIFPADIVSFTTAFNFNIGLNAMFFENSAALTGSVNNLAVFSGTTLSSLGMVAGEQVNVSWQGDSALIRTFAVPVPEPSTLALLVLGLAGLGWRRRSARIARQETL